MPVTTSNRYSAFQPLQNPANVCDFIESTNLTEEEVTRNSSVKLRPRSNMKTRWSVPAQNKKTTGATETTTATCGKKVKNY